MDIQDPVIQRFIEDAIAEDVGPGDITSLAVILKMRTLAALCQARENWWWQACPCSGYYP